jgi:hypothetical protein
MPKNGFLEISVKNDPKSKISFLVIAFININKLMQKSTKKIVSKTFYPKKFFFGMRLPNPIESDPLIR